jgi:hypothetical protein
MFQNGSEQNLQKYKFLFKAQPRSLSIFFRGQNENEMSLCLNVQAQNGTNGLDRDYQEI